LTGDRRAGYAFITMKTHISIIQCRGYAYDGVLKAVRESVDSLGGVARFVKPGQKVLLKPNLLLAALPDKGITTHPMVVKAVAELVRGAGGVPFVGDSPISGTAHRVAAKAGIAHVAEEMGCPIVDFRKTVEVKTPEDFTFRQFKVAEEAVESDVIINLPKIKTHGQMLLTLGIKNMFGCLPGTSKLAWHLRAGIDRMYIMDGVVGMEGNGPSGGTTRPLDMVLAGTDCVSLDSTITHLLGLPRNRLWTTRVAVKHGLGEASPDNIDVRGAVLDSLTVPHFKLPESGEIVWGFPGFLKGLLKDAVLPRPVIDHDRCEECLRCVEVCPAKAMDKGSRVVINRDRCIRCFCCQEICPEGAIEIRAGFVSRALGRRK
jgi:uncharacterized protein (DUF362 family)/NAD-dependent dihydropyrimidine dehydrogenase PreA subunit